MNFFAGRFEAGSSSGQSHHLDDHLERGPDGSVVIPDAHLLFSGNYARSGADLIVSDSSHRVVVPDYFRGEKRPNLVSSDGAPLDPKVISALTGHAEYAQAGTSPAAAVIGHVVKMTGSASVVRNGVSIVLNVGDNLNKNDVVQTGSGSTLGLVLDDGTAFNLSASTRFMLNDLNYEQNGSSNSSLMTLVQGAASFVAGQVAPTGDMKVATPTATLGIRGTAVILDVSATDGSVSISVVDQHDNTVHTVEVFNNLGTLIASATSNGSSLSLTPSALNVVVQSINKTPGQATQEFNVFQQVLNTYDIGKQQFPNLPQHTENTNPDNTNPTGTKTAYGSTPTLPSEPPTTSVFADGGKGDDGGSVTQTSGTPTGLGDASGAPTGSLTPPINIPIILGQPAPIETALHTPIQISTLGGATNQSGQTISGTVDPLFIGSSVTIFDDHDGVRTTIGTTTVGSGGAWSADIALVGNGSHSIVAQDVKAASTSTPVVFTLQTVAPTVAITSPVTSTNHATQTISGTVTSTEAAPGATVTLFDTVNGVTSQIGTATVGANGVWSASVTLSGDGAHSIVARDIDVVGNVGTSTPVVFTLDTVPPAVTIESAAHTSNVATQTISGSVTSAGAASGATVTLFDTVNGVTSQIGTASVGENGTWSTSVTLSGEGAHSIVAMDTDAAGNTGTSNPVVLTLDTVPPVVTIGTAAHTSNVATQTLSGTVTSAGAAPGTTVTLFDTINGVTSQIGTATVGANGTWSTSVTLAGDGAHSIVARDTDAAGNTGASNPVVLTLDTLAPTVTISTAPETSNVATQTISGTVTSVEATAGATVTLFDTINGVTSQIGTATVGANGVWSTSVTLSGDGAHSIVARDTDAVGNTGTSNPVVLTLDTVPPVVTISTASETSNVATQNIAGVVGAGDAAIGSIVRLFDTINGVTSQIGTATVGAGGAWSTSVTLSGEGAHLIVAADTDAAGNIGTSNPVVFTLNTVAPTVTISTASETSNVATHTVSGTVTSAEAAPGATVTLFDTINGVTSQIGTATVGENGAWSTSVTLAGDGAHAIVARDTDAAGNTGASNPVVLTLDTVAPTVTIGTAAHTSNIAAQTISGTVTSAEAAPGATVTLFDTINGVTSQIGTATVGTNGTWSTSVTLAGDGAHSIVARDTDAAGNTGSSNPVVLTLDTVAPTVTIGTAAHTSNVAAQTISGTVTSTEAAPGATVTLFDTINGVTSQIGTATVGTNGTWSTSVTLAGDGAHSIVARDTDAAGNTGSSSPVVFTLNTVAPTVTISTASETSNVATHTISGTVTSAEAAPGTTVTLFDTINGVTSQIGTATVGENGAWSTSVTLAGDGAHAIVARDTDAAGNTGASNPVVLTLDTVAPTVTIGTAAHTSNVAAQTISGTVTSTEAAPGATVTLFDTINGVTSQIGTATIGANGVWSTSVTLAGDGAHAIVARDTDTAGNTGASNPVVLTLDTVAPVVTIGTAAHTSNVAAQTISGTVTSTEAAPGATVTLFDTINGVTSQIGTATVGTNGTWSTSVTLSGDGAHAIVARDTDAAGNTGASNPVVLTLDTVAPTVTIGTAAHTSNVAAQTISGTVTSTEAAPGATVTLFDTINGVTSQIGTATVGANGVWSTSVTLAGDGAHSIVARDTDAAGNTGTSSPVVLTLDTVPPVVTINTASESSNVATQTVAGVVSAGDAAAGSIVTLFDTINDVTSQIGTATVGANGAWSTSVTLSGEGAHSIVAMDTDAAGNTGTSNPVVLTLDTLPPTVTITTASETSNVATQNIAGVVSAGDAAIGSTVTLFETANGVTSQIGTATVGANGAWSTSVTLSGEGAHSIVAEDTDAVGNTGTSNPVVLTLDTVAPVVTITSPGVTSTIATQTISGTASAADAGSIVTIYDSVTANSSITPVGAALLTAGNNLVNGLGGATGFGTNVLALGDDNSSAAIDITSVFGAAGVDFFGRYYTSLYINNNGNITFASPSSTYTPAAINAGANNPIIAAFWADVDTRGGAGATTPGGNSNGANQVIYNLDPVNGVLTVTWDDVGYYNSAKDKLNAFQIQLVSLGNGNFDIVYRYENVDWTTGSASGGQGGLGGTPARAGYSAGNGTDYYELPQSGNQAALLGLPNELGNTGIQGVDVFQVENGVVGTPTTTIVGTAVVQADGTWSTTVSLAPGTNTLTATDTDAAGNTGTSGPAIYTVQPVQWISSTSGSWTTASNWSTGATPGAQNDVLVNPAVNVSLSGSTTINELSTSAGSTITVTGGLVVASASNIAGSIQVTSGSADFGGAVTGGGSFSIGNGATLEFGGSVAAGIIISFLASEGTLKLDHSLSAPFQATISNMDAVSAGVHDNIDLADLHWLTTSSAIYTATPGAVGTGVLTVSDGIGHTETFHLVNYTGAGTFFTANDGQGGTLVYDPPAPTASTAVASTQTPAGEQSQDISTSPLAADSNASQPTGVDGDGVPSTDGTHHDSGSPGSGSSSAAWHFAANHVNGFAAAAPPAQSSPADAQPGDARSDGSPAAWHLHDKFVFKPGTETTGTATATDHAADKFEAARIAITEMRPSPVDAEHDGSAAPGHLGGVLPANPLLDHHHPSNFAFFHV